MLLFFCFCATENKCYLRFRILFTLAEVSKNNFRSCIFSLNNGWTVYNKLKETAEVTHCNNYPHSTALQPQNVARIFSDEKKTLLPERRLEKNNDSQKVTGVHTPIRTYCDGAQFPSSPSQLQLIASANEWLGPIFFFFLPQQDLTGREDEGGREREIKTKTSTCHGGAINRLINSEPLPDFPRVCLWVWVCLCVCVCVYGWTLQTL